MAKSSSTKTRRRPTRRSAKSGGLGGWIFVGLIAVAGILFQENQSAAMKFIGRYIPLERSETQQAQQRTPERKQKPDQRKATLVTVPKPVQRPVGELAAAEPAFTGVWFLCASRTDNCIIDSGTILHHGQKIRIADIATPETTQAKCDAERERGVEATMRLREILNEGRFSEVAWAGPDEDRSGRKLRVLIRNGTSVGQRLVAEGLARKWTDKRQSWCDSKV